jgi:CRP-like cAMP-binding protein
LIEKHLLKLRARDDVGPKEEEAIRGLISHTIDLPADKVFIQAGRDLSESTLLLDGWMARAKDLQSGQRQLAELHIAGDFVDLHSFTLKRLDHDIITLSRCLVAVVPHQRLKEITERYPHLTRLYWFMTNLDAAIQRERTLSLGRRAAISRLAHLFCELRLRLRVVGLVQNDAYEFPLTQVEIGECVGLTSVHVNRMLQELRRQGVLELENREVKILDLRALESIAEYDDRYLYLDKRPR